MHNPVAILIIFFNKLSQTIECIESFIPSGQKIYILNNASEENSWRVLQSKYNSNSRIVFFNSIENIGPARGRNLLIKNTAEDWLFLVDNDITIEPENWLTVFQNYLLKKPEVKIICPRLYNVHEKSYVVHPEFIKRGNEVLLKDSNLEVNNYFPSGASIVTRSVFDNFGLFEESLFGFEDYEYAIRLLCHPDFNLEVHNINEITLRHNHQFQKKRVDKNAVKERYNKHKLEESFRLIEKKHDVKFEHNWEWWSMKQINDMTKSSFLEMIKKMIKK